MAKPSILGTIMRVESGGRNVPQQIDDRNMRAGDPAQGYFQITGGTWRDFGGDKTGHGSAIDAPYPTQLQIAQNIPVERWGPATQDALKAAGYEAKPGETLGAMLARYGEDANATRPEDVGGSTVVAGLPTPPATNPLAGLLAQQQQIAQAAALAKASATAAQDEAKQGQGFQGIAKEGVGLLGPSTAAAPQFLPAPGIYRPQPQPLALGGGGSNSDFAQLIAQQRLQRRA